MLVDRSEVDKHIDYAVRYELLEGIYTSRLEASRRIFGQPMFIDSKRFRTLQLADLIAYTIRRVMAKMPKAAGGIFDFEKWYNEIILRKILRRNSAGEVEGYGLKIWVE